MEKLQQRTITIKGTIKTRELNTNENETPELIIEGILPYNVPSEEMYIGYGSYTLKHEVITPTAWVKVISDGSNIYLNYNHNDDLILGSTKSRTLTIENKEDGLHFTCILPNTDIGNRTYQTIKRGDVTTLSFEFIPQEYYIDDNLETVFVTSGILSAISVCVVNPAYTTSKVEARNLKDKIKTIKENIKQKEIEEMDKEDVKELKELLLSILEKLPDDKTQEEKQKDDKSNEDQKEKEESEEIKKMIDEIASLTKEIEILKKENKEV